MTVLGDRGEARLRAESERGPAPETATSGRSLPPALESGGQATGVRRTSLIPPLVPIDPALRYEVVRRLGGGGMGVVHEAFDRERGHLVALKSLANFSPSALYAFKREFRALADVEHPNLVHLYDLVATGIDRDDRPRC